ncbi:F0F1 ATP synthase subunit B [Paenibacillus sp. YN15]|uniref:F0F1 ATP synthase subunit B n=1 Tax=Paenibacillus sp. YN15 TaxID=1742774 RepID=UPI000DCD2E2C|nr:F0F1 ATP synthase subunit B [Paenibacillus sp. YN15]RAV03152.1 ATP synthase F0 subunit B [Paenibacillus sp. YN15]
MSFHWESTLFAVLAFGLLYFVLNKFAFGPLFSVMEKRRELVQSQLKAAEDSRTQAEQFMQEQKKAMQDVRKEAFQIVEQARTSSLRQSEELLKQAKDESVRLKQEALNDIQAEKNKAVAALKGQVGAMSVLIASKIIEKQIDEKSQQDLVEQYLKEVGDKG